MSNFFHLVKSFFLMTHVWHLFLKKRYFIVQRNNVLGIVIRIEESMQLFVKRPSQNGFHYF